MVTTTVLKFYNKYYNLFIFSAILLFSIILYIIDLTVSDGNTCLKQINNTSNKVQYAIIIFIHNIIIYTIILGWLFNDKRILVFLILFILFVLIQWYVLDKCFVTVASEKICKNKESNYFNDIFKMIGLKKYPVFNNIIFHALLFIILCGYVYKVMY